MANYLQELATKEIKNEALRTEVLKACRGIGASSNAPESFVRIIGTLERQIEELHTVIHTRVLGIRPPDDGNPKLTIDPPGR